MARLQVDKPVKRGSEIVKTKAELDNVWREGDRLVPAVEAAAAMNMTSREFHRIDKGAKPAGWPRCYMLSARVVRYSFLDAQDYGKANPGMKGSGYTISDTDMEVLCLNPQLCDGDDYAYAEDICQKADVVDAKIGLDTLMCCVREGPIWEGNLPSKVERDQLHALGLIHPIVVKDEEGFWGANYTARRVLAVVENRRKERKGD